ncbi:MAG: hypothetical protein AB7S88_05000, partial [Candidatus Izemoplasmatales bacterium]
AKIMINRYPISRVVTCTTRPKRIAEIDGFDYHFFDEETFFQHEKLGYFAETAKYNGYWYGTPMNEIADDKLIILEPQGLSSFLKLHIPSIVAIYLNTSESCRIDRMRIRKDKEEDIAKRIASDRVDFNLERIEGLDLIVDTTEMTLSNLADFIYKNYHRILEEKKLGYVQISLFQED